MKTKLNKWYNDRDGIYTRESWEIPEAGTEIWCTSWKRGQTIKPHGDGCHVVVGYTVYHCDELMGIMEQREREGEKWGIEGVEPSKEQRINGYWTKIKNSLERV